MPNPQEGHQLMAVTLAVVQPLPANDTPPEHTVTVMEIADAMADQGVTPALLRRYPDLAVYVPPLEALGAARGMP